MASESVDVPSGTDFTWTPSGSAFREMQVGFPNGALTTQTKVTAVLERHGQTSEYRLSIHGDRELAASYFLALPDLMVEHISTDHVIDHGLHFTPTSDQGGAAPSGAGILAHDRITLHTSGAVVVEHEDWGYLTRGHDSHDAEAPTGTGAPPEMGWTALGGSALTVTNGNNSGVGSLRWAIQLANSNAGRDYIGFRVGAGGSATIAAGLGSPLPTITDPVEIDGTTQPGFAALPLIEITGVAAGAGANGFSFASGSESSVVRGLVIHSFQGNAIDIASDGVRVFGCFLGVDAAGTAAMGNANGIYVHANSEVVIGGSATGERNIISGNLGAGIVIEGSSAVIKGNYIGLDSSGTASLGNQDGIVLEASATGTIIGDEVDGRNVISGNSGTGIIIDGSSATVAGNYVGTNAPGNAAIGNGTGVDFLISSTNNLVGGSGWARNVISGNVGDGVVLDGTSNSVVGNYIGKNASGSTNLVNGGSTIAISGTSTGHTVTGNLTN